MHVLQLTKKNLLVLCALLSVIALQAATLQRPYNPFLKNGTDQPELVVVIASYNNEKFFYRNLDSVAYQKLNVPFRVIYINDCSTDKTGKLVDSYVRTHNLESMCTVIHNEKRVGILENHYNVISTLPDNAIVVLLDGDDFFAHDGVLDELWRVYSNRNIWFAYSQFIYYPEGWIIGSACPQSVLDENSFRDYDWVTSHVKTFYAGLFKRIDKEDLFYQGNFFTMAGDLAIMFPMAEMASRGHIAYIPEVLYGYNHENPISDHNKNIAFQTKMCCFIRDMPRYEPIVAEC